MFLPFYSHKRNLKMCFGPVESFGPVLMSLVIKQTEKRDKLPSIERILPKQNSSNFFGKY